MVDRMHFLIIMLLSRNFNKSWCRVRYIYLYVILFCFVLEHVDGDMNADSLLNYMYFYSHILNPKINIHIYSFGRKVPFVLMFSFVIIVWSITIIQILWNWISKKVLPYKPSLNLNICENSLKYQDLECLFHWADILVILKQLNSTYLQ